MEGPHPDIVVALWLTVAPTKIVRFICSDVWPYHPFAIQHHLFCTKPKGIHCVWNKTGVTRQRSNTQMTIGAPMCDNQEWS